MNIGEYTLVNAEKVERAINGTLGKDAAFKGGVGSENPEALMAEYDRLGGLITKGGERVKTGCFYDFKAKKPKENPEVVFLYRVNGTEVEVPEGAEKPLAVKAAEVLAADNAEKAEAKEEKRKSRRKLEE